MPRSRCVVLRGFGVFYGDGQWGGVSVDGPLAANLVEEILEISGGCVCCDARDELAWGLKELVVDCQVDVVGLECCGVAQVRDVIDGITEPCKSHE